jgi:hypothetical protein
MNLPATDSNPIESRMLDSIKATLTRVLGPDSAQAVEFYVDNHLALEDPAAFEQALADFLGSQAGGLLIEAIKSDLRKEDVRSGKSKIPEPVSKFLSHKVTVANRPPASGVERRSPPPGAHFERFVEAAKHATETGITFKDLVTEGLVLSQGETCGYATIACLGRKALDDPAAFAQRVASIFRLEGIAVLTTLTAFCEVKAKGRQLAVF